MIVPLKKLKDGVHEFRGMNSPDKLKLDSEVFTKDITTVITVDKRGLNYYVTVDSRGDCTFPCDRCLERFEKEIISSSKIVFTEDSSLINDNRKDGVVGDDIRYIKPDETDLDFSDEIKQFLMLDVPLKNLCSEDCKGLCSQCGKNLNEGECNCSDEHIDPRWEKLRGLK